MAALTARSIVRLLLAAAVMLPLAAGAAPPKKATKKRPAAAAPAPAPAPEPAIPAPASTPAPAVPDDPAMLVKAAEASFGQAEFEHVRDYASRAVKLLDAAPSSADGSKLRARALDLLAQAHYNLGDRAAVGPAMDWLIETDPAYHVDAGLAGAKYVEMFEQHRKKMVGYIVPNCAPAPCDTATVDGRPATIDSEGRIAALVGKRSVTLGRQNFKPVTVADVAVTAGEKTPVTAQLEAIARDVQIATRPAGARVAVDGKDVGITVAGSEPEGPSRPLVVPGLGPGPHAIVVQAPCWRRVEQSVDVVLDAQSLQPQDAGTVELERARSILQIAWDNPAGTLTVDGRPAQAGPVEVCPGRHEVSLSLGGRRAWVETLETKDEESVPLTPAPRPTVAIVRADIGATLPGFPGKAWNDVELAPASAEALAGRVASQIGDVPPVYPAVKRVPIEGLAAEARAAAPEADLVALILTGRDAIRPVRVLALVDTRREAVEITAWPEKDAKVAAAIAEDLVRPLHATTGYTGLEFADRASRPPIVAAVQPDSPAGKAGLSPGQVVTAWAGKPVMTMLDIPPETDLAPGTPVTVKVQDAKGERDVTVVPVTALFTPSPAALRQGGGLLLPLIARSELARLVGSPEERSAAGLLVGLTLAALRFDADAASALDRASVDEAFDPLGDARGTQWFVLDTLLRRLGRNDYAAEVHARWKLLERARLGGRGGPPLRAALDASPE